MSGFLRIISCLKVEKEVEAKGNCFETDLSFSKPGM